MKGTDVKIEGDAFPRCLCYGGVYGFACRIFLAAKRKCPRVAVQESEGSSLKEESRSDSSLRLSVSLELGKCKGKRQMFDAGRSCPRATECGNRGWGDAQEAPRQGRSREAGLLHDVGVLRVGEHDPLDAGVLEKGDAACRSGASHSELWWKVTNIIRVCKTLGGKGVIKNTRG